MTKFGFHILLFVLIVYNRVSLGQTDSKTESSDGPKIPEVKSSIKPKHVALVVGCHSHAMLHNHLAYTLHNKATSAEKYRVSYVTGAQCRDIPERLGGVNIFDTGEWFYPSKDPNMSGAEYVKNYTRGEIVYPTRAVEALIREDRPDLIISDNICLATGTIAEVHDIPFVIAFRPSIPPISMHAE
ncbi:uncharacterized protein LOC134848028 [Symsagittifera roscoffensis]